MSNLIKSVYFQMDPKGNRVIDSDQKVTQFIPGIFSAGRERSSLEFEGPEDYHDGMNIVAMDDVRQEERDRIAEETSRRTEQLLMEAREQAEEILERARQEAESIRANAFEEGKRQGIADGQQVVAGELNKRREELEMEWQARYKELEAEEEELEPKFAEIMGDLIEKVTGILCQDKKEIILYLIHQAMHQLDKTNSIVIRVSKDDIVWVSEHRQELERDLDPEVRLDVSEDESLSAKQCIIETDHRMIDCSLDVEIQNLRDQIRMLTIL